MPKSSVETMCWFSCGFCGTAAMFDWLRRDFERDVRLCCESTMPVVPSLASTLFFLRFVGEGFSSGAVAICAFLLDALLY